MPQSGSTLNELPETNLEALVQINAAVKQHWFKLSKVMISEPLTVNSPISLEPLLQLMGE